MGEPDSFPSSNPIYIVIMRNSRGKLFVYLAVLGVVCFIVFLLSNTHTNLKELEGVSEKCHQQRDSLSAQLQVVYEHKNRLEKSLQQEKTDLKHAKEANEKTVSELENKFQKEKEEKQKFENQVSQLKLSYSQLEDEKLQADEALKQQLKTVQTQKDSEIEKLQTHISELLSEKDKLENSNNAFVWKIEQRASELNLCQLQLQQAKAELRTCQETYKHVPPGGAAEGQVAPLANPEPTHAALNAIDHSPVPVVDPLQQTKKVLPHEDVGNPMQEQAVLPKAPADAPLNATAQPPSHDHASLLAKPHLMPANNLGDGVLPRPMGAEPDAALELTDSKKPHPVGVEPMAEDALVDHFVNRDVDNENMIDGHVMRREGVLPAAPPPDPHQPAADNHPQVAAPNFDEKDDHAAERGEDGIQYSNVEAGGAKQQVELPHLGRPHAPPPKEFFPPPADNDAQQMRDMMNKSPGEVLNNPPDNNNNNNVLGAPPHQHPEHRNRPFMHRGADGHRVMDDKNYEEDDDDRENDDEPPNGLAPAMKGVNNLLQDNDFDDQENQDNADNAKEEEGVVVAPK